MSVPARRLTHGLLGGRESERVPRTQIRVRRRRKVPFLLFSFLVVAATVVGLVSAQALVAQGSFRVTDLTAEAERLEVDYGRLRLEVAQLSSPDRIVTAARRAGLVLPEEVEILRLPTSEVRRDPRPSSGAVLALKGVLGGGE
jgi:cell division protein FtsL